MTRSNEHIEFDELNDFADGILTDARKAIVVEHLSMCDTCRVEHENIIGLMSSTRDLPRSVLPEPDIWPGLRRQLDSRKEAVLRTAASQPEGAIRRSREHSSVWRSGPFLAAAAVVLMVASSAVTAAVFRAGWVPASRSDSTLRAPTIQDRAPALLIGFYETEAEYRKTIAELKTTVDLQRSSLSPETIRTVDRSLAVVDSAIKEARAALLADPNNQVLVDLLSATYQRKLDLLRRTSELGSRT
jgi:putative zinc finger protein